jgi:hypothetical protein
MHQRLAKQKSAERHAKMENSGKQQGIEYKKKDDGSVNPKYVDVLDEDKPIAGQSYCCVSFLSPEKILKNRELFMFSKFLNKWDIKKSLEKYSQFLHFVSYKYGIDFDKLNADMNEFCKEEGGKLFASSLEDEFKTYLDNNEEKLEKEFNEENKFQTSVRGLKVRGSFNSQQEAEMRCKTLREIDPNHDVYVGQVGIWMPFHPEAYKTGRVEYLEEELNQLMHEKNKNETTAKTEFDKRIRETKEKAMEENRQKALTSGNVLTQTLNSDGNLVSVKDSNAFNPMEIGENDDYGYEEIKKRDKPDLNVQRTLFESDNIVIDHKKSDKDDL